MKKIGFIGCGNMGQAILTGIRKKDLVPAKNIYVSVKHADKLLSLEQTYGIHACRDNAETAREADILFLAVKPQFYEEVIAGIRDEVRDDQVIISLAPGKTIAWLEDHFGASEGKIRKLARIMPNTPAGIGEGMTALCPGKNLSEEEIREVEEILQSFGRVEQLEERLMDAFVSVAGSSPAYVYMFIEAMADAAVADGIPRDKAYRFAAQAVLGSAKMVLDTGKHPGQLKDAVCSPGGTTIEAVRVLEAKGFRSAVFEAMKACTEKSRSM